MQVYLNVRMAGTHIVTTFRYGATYHVCTSPRSIVTFKATDFKEECRGVIHYIS